MFGPLEFSRRDLMAINIQRGRDHGIPDYNSVREAYGLERRKSFLEINPDFFTNDPRGREVMRILGIFTLVLTVERHCLYGVGQT